MTERFQVEGRYTAGWFSHTRGLTLSEAETKLAYLRRWYHERDWRIMPDWSRGS